jgi:biopolymer transport protein TolR
MIPYRRRKRPLMGEINVVPYIDVMLVLLVIFMITAPLLTQGVKVELPQASAKPVDMQEQEPIVVTVDKRGRYFLEDKAIGREALVTRVSAVLRVQPQTPVLIRGDRQVAYQDVVDAMVLLQAAGAPSVGLVTQPADGK